MKILKLTKIAILGPGLIGGSLLLACRARLLTSQIAVWGRCSSGLQEIQNSGVTCSTHTSVAEAVENADLIILCVPIGAMRGVLEQGFSKLSHDAVVTDVGSVKGCVVRELEPLLADRAHWIGSHPMAGRELAGFSAAKANLFEGATTVVTPTALTTPYAQQIANRFWTALGSHVIELPPDIHDSLVAQISHLPHLVAAALTQAVSPESLSLVGTGFRDTTRVAAGPAEMWREILLTNRDAVGESLDRLMEILRLARQALSEEDDAHIKNLLTRANQVRQRIVKS